MDKFEKVTWLRASEFFELMLRHDIYVVDDEALPQVEKVLTGRDWSFGLTNNLDGKFSFARLVNRGYGYIKKEVDWTDVVSEDNPILCLVWNSNNSKLLRTVTEYKKVGAYRYECDNDYYQYAELITKEEVLAMTWECMNND